MLPKIPHGRPDTCLQAPDWLLASYQVKAGIRQKPTSLAQPDQGGLSVLAGMGQAPYTSFALWRCVKPNSGKPNLSRRSLFGNPAVTRAAWYSLLRIMDTR
jgi:hypothetical protein